MDGLIFCWRKVFNAKPLGSILGGILVNTFIDDLSKETDGMLIMFLDDRNLESRPKSRSQ